MMQHNEEGTIKDLVNYRAYYAIFHAISAIHVLDGNSYKRHKDAIGNFNKNYVKTGIFPKDYNKKIINAEYIRKSSDYDYLYIVSKPITADLISTAEELTSLIKEYCDNRINNATHD